MKLKIETKVTEEREITIPYFFKIDYKNIEPTFYGILSENLAVSVSERDVAQYYASSVANNITSELAVEITEEEFFSAMEKRLNEFKTLIPQTV